MNVGVNCRFMKVDMDIGGRLPTSLGSSLWMGLVNTGRNGQTRPETLDMTIGKGAFGMWVFGVTVMRKDCL